MRGEGRGEEKGRREERGGRDERGDRERREEREWEEEKEELKWTALLLCSPSRPLRIQHWLVTHSDSHTK